MKKADSYEDLLDALDGLLDQGMKLPLSNGRCIVDAEKFRDIIDELRTRTPQQIQSAQKIVADRSKILKEASAEGENIIKKAEARAKDIIDNDDLTKQARQRAEQIQSDAIVKGREIINAAKGYADDLLKRAEDSLAESMSEIRKTRQNLKNVSASSVVKGVADKQTKKSSDLDD